MKSIITILLLSSSFLSYASPRIKVGAGQASIKGSVDGFGNFTDGDTTRLSLGIEGDYNHFVSGGLEINKLEYSDNEIFTGYRYQTKTDFKYNYTEVSPFLKLVFNGTSPDIRPFLKLAISSVAGEVELENVEYNYYRESTTVKDSDNNLALRVAAGLSFPVGESSLIDLSYRTFDHEITGTKMKSSEIQLDFGIGL